MSVGFGFIVSVPDDPLRFAANEIKGLFAYIIASRRMMLSLREGKVFSAGIASLKCV